MNSGIASELIVLTVCDDHFSFPSDDLLWRIQMPGYLSIDAGAIVPMERTLGVTAEGTPTLNGRYFPFTETPLGSLAKPGGLGSHCVGCFTASVVSSCSRDARCC